MKEERKKYYKIEAGDIIEIIRNDYMGKTFYKTPIKKINVFDKEETYEKTIRFKGNPDIPDHTFIKVLDFIEDAYYRKSDKYNAVWHIVVLDYEVVESKEAILRAFNKTIEENQMLSAKDKEYMDVELPF